MFQHMQFSDCFEGSWLGLISDGGGCNEKKKSINIVLISNKKYFFQSFFSNSLLFEIFSFFFFMEYNINELSNKQTNKFTSTL